MKNEILLIMFVFGTVLCVDSFSKGDISFDNMKVNLKKIQKKQSESPESPKEQQKQTQAQKSQKELLAEQLQQIERYTPTNVTIQGGRVFSQQIVQQDNERSEFTEEEAVQSVSSSESEDINYDEEDNQLEDEVLAAITQIDQDAQFDAIEFIFKKRQIDYDRMKSFLMLSNNQQISVSIEQIQSLSEKYSFTKLFEKAATELNIQIIIEDDEQIIQQDEYSDDEDEQVAQETEQIEPDLQFDDLIEFDNDEVNDFKTEEQIDSSDDTDEIDLFDTDMNNEDFINQEFDDDFNFEEQIIKEQQIEIEETHYEEKFEELFEEQLEIAQPKNKLDSQLPEFEFIQEEWFEELHELEFEEEEEQQVFNQQVKQENDPQNTPIQNLEEPIKTYAETQQQVENQQPETSLIQIEKEAEQEIILTKEEQQKTYINDSVEFLSPDFQEVIVEQDVKIEKEFNFNKKAEEDKSLLKLSTQFNLSEDTLNQINQKYESMDQQHNLYGDAIAKKGFEPELIQMSQSTEIIEDSNQTAFYLNEEQNQVIQQSFKSEFNFLNSNNAEEQQVEQVEQVQQMEQKKDEKQAQQNEQETKEEKSKEKVIEPQVEEKSQNNKAQKQIPQSKPAQPAEVEFETTKKDEKSDEEREKEKELKAKARYAKRYQALDIGNEKQQKQEQEETHFVKVEQNIDDIFIIQSLTSSKKNNVVDIKNLDQPLKQEELNSASNEDQNNIEVHNSVTEQHLKKISNQRTQHFVEAFVQDMSLKSYSCDPGYYGPHKEARQFCCKCSNKIFLLDEESWYLAGTIPFYKTFEKLFEQIKKTIPIIYAGISKDAACFSSQMHQPVIINDFLRELFFKTKIQNSFIQIPNIISLNYMQLEYSENQVRNFIIEAESNDEVKLNQGFNIRQIIMKLAQENLNIQYIGSFQLNRQQVPFRLTNQYGSLRIDTIEITVLLPQDEHICIAICEQILSGDVAQQLKAFINFKKGQYQITVKVLSSEDSFEIFYSLKS